MDTFQHNGGYYWIDYVPDNKSVPIKDAGYRLYKASYHTHRKGKKLKTKNQRPRWKLLGIFTSRSDAVRFVEESE